MVFPETLCYQIYGLVVEVDFDLGILPLKTNPTRPVDVRICRSPYPLSLKAQNHSGSWLTYEKSSEAHLRLTWEDHFSFEIDFEKNQIFYHKNSRLSLESLSCFLFGPVLSTFHLEKGLEPLHGTALYKGGKTIALLGQSGYGKSTLAAEFLRQGWKLWTDDMLALTYEDGCFQISSGLPRLKLYPDSAHLLLAKSNLFFDSSAMTLDSQKRVYSLPDQTESLPKTLPISAFFQIKESEKHFRGPAVLSAMDEKEKFLCVLENIYNLFIDHNERRAQQFNWAKNLSKSCDFYYFQFERNYSRLAQTVASLSSVFEPNKKPFLENSLCELS